MIVVKEDAICVVCCSDENLVMPLAVTLKSMFMNYKDDRQLIVYVIDGGITPRSRARLTASLELYQQNIEFLTLDETLLKNMMVSHHINLRAYYRLLLPSVLPKDVKKVIYLDSDLIVRHNIVELWDLAMGEYCVLAAQEQGEDYMYVSSPLGLSNFKELGIKPDCKYFNSGVLVINIDKWRREDLVSRFLQYTEDNKQYIRWWDQDVLNAVLAHQWGELDSRWNMQQNIFTNSSWDKGPLKEKDAYERLIRDPFIVHFTSSVKPWHMDNKNPYKGLFYQYLDMTAWKEWRPNGLSKAELRRTARSIWHKVRKVLSGGHQ